VVYVHESRRRTPESMTQSETYSRYIQDIFETYVGSVDPVSEPPRDDLVVRWCFGMAPVVGYINCSRGIELTIAC
jgi:hypothetical protein